MTYYLNQNIKSMYATPEYGNNIKVIVMTHLSTQVRTLHMQHCNSCQIKLTYLTGLKFKTVQKYNF